MSLTATRIVVLSLLCLATTNAYLTRVMSAPATTLQRELALSDAQLGEVLAAFALGYFVFQVPGGLVASAFGVRRVFPVLAIAWSLACLAVTRAESATEIRRARFLLGVFQAGLVPCCAQALSEWFADRSRGIASSLVAIGMQFGAVLGSGMTAALMPHYGWRPVFTGYAISGLVWAVAFAVLYRDRPIPRPTTEPQPDGGWSVLVKMTICGSLWAVCIQSAFRAFGYEFYTTWFPAYLERAKGVKVVESGLLGMLPLAAFGIGTLAGGLVVDAVYRRTDRKYVSRSVTAATGLLLAAGCTLSATQATGPRSAAVVLACGTFCAALAGPAAWAATLDISGRRSALVFGIMNFVGNVGAYACPRLVGLLFAAISASEVPNWDRVLWLFAGVSLAGAGTWLLLDPERKAAD